MEHEESNILLIEKIKEEKTKANKSNTINFLIGVMIILMATFISAFLPLEF